MLFDFAVTCRADDEKVSAQLKHLGMAGTVHAITWALDQPYKELAGPASTYHQ
jgi:hypothetical protein